MPLVNLEKLDIRDGVIHYFVYAQNGEKIPMTVRDTLDMRRFVSWVQIHDAPPAAIEALNNQGN